MTTLLQISLNFSSFSFSNYEFCRKPIHCYCLSRIKTAPLQQNSFKWKACGYGRQRRSLLELGWGKDGSFVKEEGGSRRRTTREVLVRFNQGFGFNDGGGGGGGRDDGTTARLLGNIALAVGLTYLSMTGQLGWLLDAIVSIWLLAVILPIVGLGAFLWWAGRDIVQSSCPNCGNDFQIFKSSLNDELQLCPFCSQPFSVVDDKFVKEPVKFSNQSTTFNQAFSGFSSGSKKGKNRSAAIVDVEAEIKDAE